MDYIQESGSAGKLLAQHARLRLVKGTCSYRDTRSRISIDCRLVLTPELYLTNVASRSEGQGCFGGVFITIAPLFGLGGQRQRSTWNKNNRRGSRRLIESFCYLSLLGTLTDNPASTVNLANLDADASAKQTCLIVHSTDWHRREMGEHNDNTKPLSGLPQNHPILAAELSYWRPPSQQCYGFLTPTPFQLNSIAIRRSISLFTTISDDLHNSRPR